MGHSPAPLLPLTIGSCAMRCYGHALAGLFDLPRLPIYRAPLLLGHAIADPPKNPPTVLSDGLAQPILIRTGEASLRRPVVNFLDRRDVRWRIAIDLHDVGD